MKFKFRKMYVITSLMIAVFMLSAPVALAAKSGSGTYTRSKISVSFSHDPSLGYSKLVTTCKNSKGTRQTVELQRYAFETWYTIKTSWIYCSKLGANDEIRWLRDSYGNLLPKGTYRHVFVNPDNGGSTTNISYTIY